MGGVRAWRVRGVFTRFCHLHASLLVSPCTSDGGGGAPRPLFSMTVNKSFSFFLPFAIIQSPHTHFCLAWLIIVVRLYCFSTKYSHLTSPFFFLFSACIRLAPRHRFKKKIKYK